MLNSKGTLKLFFISNRLIVVPPKSTKIPWAGVKLNHSV